MYMIETRDLLNVICKVLVLVLAYSQLLLIILPVIVSPVLFLCRVVAVQRDQPVT